MINDDEADNKTEPELPDDPEQLKKIINALQAESVDTLAQLEEALMGMKALVSSWRWRVGHGVVSLAERLLRRRDVRLATDHVISILQGLTRRHRDREQFGLNYLAELGAEGLRLFAGKGGKENYTRYRSEELETFLASDERLQLGSGTSKPKVTILLVLYNRAELTYACLKSIIKSVRTPYQVVVVDNASSDRTEELLQRIDGAAVIRNSTNEGFLKACNQGADLAEGDFLLFLNNDAVLVGDAVSLALAVFEEEDRVGGVGGRILLLDGKLQEAGSICWRDGSCLGYGRADYASEPEYMFRRDVDYCSGAFLMVPTALFDRMNRFDTAYAPAYYEETDFCLRLHESGYRVLYEPGVVILHYEFASSTESDDAIRLQSEHRQIFLDRHLQYLKTRPLPAKKNVLLGRSVSAGKRVLFIDDRVPHTYFGSGFPRSNFILNVLSDLGYQVTLYPLNYPVEDNWSTVFQDIPKSVEVMLGYGRMRLRKFLESRRDYFDIAFVSRPHNMEFFSSVAEQIYGSFSKPKIIYDAEAIFSIREAAKYELFTGKKPKDLDEMIRAEVELTKDSDAVIAVSESERALFRKYYPGQVHVVGHALDLDPSPIPFDERSDFLFVGNMDYDGSPNVDSMCWFVDEVLPLVKRSLPDVKLMLVGPNASQEIQALASEDVRLLGRQENLEEFYGKCRVFLAPTRYAGGIPYKVHEAAANGIPVVATSLIIDQLSWRIGEQILGAPLDAAADFAEQCIRLYTERNVWESVRAKALQAMQEECSISAVKKEVSAIFASF